VKIFTCANNAKGREDTMVTKVPIGGNEHLHEEIEVEEAYNKCNCGAPCEGAVLCANCHGVLRDDSIEAPENPVLERYNRRKEEYTSSILVELESFTECDIRNWTANEEGMIIDILGAVENEIKALLSRNDTNYVG
jgi:hypothetical protein